MDEQLYISDSERSEGERVSVTPDPVEGGTSIAPEGQIS